MQYLTAVAACLILFGATTVYPYQTEHVTDGGVINGVISYGGPPVSPPQLAITKDREVCGTAAIYDPSLSVGRDHGLANVVVTLADIRKGEPLTPAPAVRFDQKGCRYIPHVAVFPAGSTVVILNSDGILHNIHTESTVNPVIDLAQPGFKKQIRVTVDQPEIIKVTCDAHNWMEGWWYVTSNPYYAITDNHGRYAIHDVPPGTYTLRVWHERLGTLSQRVTVRPNAEVIANFTLKPMAHQRS